MTPPLPSQGTHDRVQDHCSGCREQGLGGRRARAAIHAASSESVQARAPGTSGLSVLKIPMYAWNTAQNHAAPTCADVCG